MLLFETHQIINFSDEGVARSAVHLFVSGQLFLWFRSFGLPLCVFFRFLSLTYISHFFFIEFFIFVSLGIPSFFATTWGAFLFIVWCYDLLLILSQQFFHGYHALLLQVLVKLIFNFAHIWNYFLVINVINVWIFKLIYIFQ